jgi:16S rRNA (adenine1518-N6/adenine1519-N6)-dimethyltransferase
LTQQNPGQKLVAIEVDNVLVHYLRQKFRDAIDAGRLEIVEGDVLQIDLGAYGSVPIRIVGNLPYYITSPILERVFSINAKDAAQKADQSPSSPTAPASKWASAVFLVQAEVAARVAALPGTRDFGYLSVMCQVQAHTDLLFEVPAAAFHPPPKVESAVIRLTPRNAAADFGIDDVPAFLRFAQTCFRHKRKTLRNNLLEAYPAERITGLKEAKLRAEQLSVGELADLWRRLQG